MFASISAMAYNEGMHANTKTFAQREQELWEQVARQPDGCWLWTGRLNDKGYGVSGRERAHRLAYLSAFQVPIAGLCVCHTCDVRNCVRPSHLWLGTKSENTRDMDAKGRRKTPLNTNRPRGEEHHSAKLKTEDVLAIRSSSKTRRGLRTQYNVSNTTIEAIQNRRRWKHV